MTSASPLAAIMARLEGYGTANAPSITQGNNPLAIGSGDVATSLGAIGESPNGTAVFPDFGTGLAAGESLISQAVNNGATPASLANQWTPPGATGNSQQSTDNYAAGIAQALGIGVNDPIPTSAVSTAPTGTQSPATGGFWSTLGDMFSKLPGPLKGVAGVTGTSQTSGLPGLGVRVVLVVLGIALVIIGVVFLRPNSSVSIAAKSAARKGVEAVSLA